MTSTIVSARILTYEAQVAPIRARYVTKITSITEKYDVR